MSAQLKQTLQEIILNNQSIVGGSTIPRSLEVQVAPGKAAICIGARRAGKSTLMAQIKQQMIDDDVSASRMLWVNFFDDRLRGLDGANLGLVLEAYLSLFPDREPEERYYCFFDEIQMVSGWEPFVDRILREENCDVYITGSSAKLLSKEIATQMRGRALTWELFPFSFVEYLSGIDIDSRAPLTTSQRIRIQAGFNQYWGAGSFPEMLHLSEDLRVRTLQEYFNTMIFRDIIERHDIAHPRAILDMAHRLAENVGCLHSLNRLYGTLKSQGHRLSKTTVADYLLWLEDAYVFFTLRLFDASYTRSNQNAKKVYCIDHVLAQAVSSNILVNAGHYLENLIYIALRRRFGEVIYYYRTEHAREVDFYVHANNLEERCLIQVCETMLDESTARREVTALREAMSELNLREGIIITREEEAELEIEEGVIKQVAAWRFLLNI